jgi:hypothetical protein
MREEEVDISHYGMFREGLPSFEGNPAQTVPVSTFQFS